MNKISLGILCLISITVFSLSIQAQSGANLSSKWEDKIDPLILNHTTLSSRDSLEALLIVKLIDRCGKDYDCFLSHYFKWKKEKKPVSPVNYAGILKPAPFFIAVASSLLMLLLFVFFQYLYGKNEHANLSRLRVAYSGSSLPSDRNQNASLPNWSNALYSPPVYQDHNYIFPQSASLNIAEVIAIKEPGMRKNKLSREDQAWRASFEDYVLQNMSKSILSVPMLAEEFAMSESTLLRQCKRLLGMPPRQYLKKVRIEKAKQLLEDKAFNSVGRIAAEVGYTDSKAFSRAFKSKYGKLPSEYI